MNVHDAKLLLTNVEKYEARQAGLYHDDRRIWSSYYKGLIIKEDGGWFVVTKPNGSNFQSQYLWSAIDNLKCN